MAAHQDGTTTNLESQPIACSLTPGDLRERLGELFEQFTVADHVNQ